MSSEGQMVFGAYGGSLATEAELESALEAGTIGGFMLFRHNLTAFKRAGGVIDRNALATRIEGFYQKAKNGNWPTPFVAVDQEGGSVQNIRAPLTIVPSAWDVGQTDDPFVASDIGSVTGSELRHLGFNTVFAPVADIWTNPANKVLGANHRCYSDDPDVAARMVKQVVDGLAFTNILSCVKHFPGHGDTANDTHLDVAWVTRSLDQLAANEFIPFAEVMATVPFVMVGHLVVQAIDPTLPFSLSPAGIGPILRNQLGFDGIVITDDLFMKGSRIKLDDSGERILDSSTRSGFAERSIAEVVQLGLDAGVDVFLSQDEWQDIYQALVDLSSDPAYDDKIQESVERIESLKNTITEWTKSDTIEADMSDLLVANQNTVARVPSTTRRDIGVGWNPPPPDCSIDYERVASLPVGVPPETIAADALSDWFTEMDATSIVFTYNRPSDDERDPGTSAKLRVSQLTNNNGALTGISLMVGRRSMPSSFVTSYLPLTLAIVDPIARRTALPLDPADRQQHYNELDRSFPWDDESRMGSGLPIPSVSDEAVVVLWGNDSSTAVPGLPSRIVGVFEATEDEPSEYLLETDVDSPGELDRKLLRAPHPGLIRFERYRHLGQDSAGTLLTIRQSAAGRVVVAGSALPLVSGIKRLLDNSRRSPWVNPINVAFENVHADSVSTHLAALLWDQLNRYELLRASPRIKSDAAIKKALTEEVSRLLQTWRSWLDFQVFFGASADVNSMASKADRLVDLADVPLKHQNLVSAVESVLADTQLKSNLKSFLIGIYASFLNGNDRTDMSVSRDNLIDGGFAAANQVQQGLLLAGQRTSPVDSGLCRRSGGPARGPVHDRRQHAGRPS